jgi:regulator of protease activity HflC (stomatin/prohibitin superfamily)
MIKASEAEKQRRINEAEGQASAIKSVAIATAEGLGVVASAINTPAGRDAAQLRVAEEYVKQFGFMAKETNTMILPANLADISGLVATAMTVIRPQSKSSN